MTFYEGEKSQKNILLKLKFKKPNGEGLVLFYLELGEL